MSIVIDSERIHNPACMFWPVPDEQIMAQPLEHEPAPHMVTWPRLRAWQDDRCALCDARDVSFVLDHSHVTGLIRGYICRGCNVSEAVSDAPIYRRWRSGWNPADLLGMEVEYFSPIDGRPTLNRQGEWLRMTPEERVVAVEDYRRSLEPMFGEISFKSAERMVSGGLPERIYQGPVPA